MRYPSKSRMSAERDRCALLGDLSTGETVEGGKRRRVLNPMTLQFPFSPDFPGFWELLPGPCCCLTPGLLQSDARWFLKKAPHVILHMVTPLYRVILLLLLLFNYKRNNTDGNRIKTTLKCLR